MPEAPYVLVLPVPVKPCSVDRAGCTATPSHRAALPDDTTHDMTSPADSAPGLGADGYLAMVSAVNGPGAYVRAHPYPEVSPAIVFTEFPSSRVLLHWCCVWQVRTRWLAMPQEMTPKPLHGCCNMHCSKNSP